MRLTIVGAPCVTVAAVAVAVRWRRWLRSLGAALTLSVVGRRPPAWRRHPMLSMRHAQPSRSSLENASAPRLSGHRRVRGRRQRGLRGASHRPSIQTADPARARHDGGQHRAARGLVEEVPPAPGFSHLRSRTRAARPSSPKTGGSARAWRRSRRSRTPRMSRQPYPTYCPFNPFTLGARLRHQPRATASRSFDTYGTPVRPAAGPLHRDRSIAAPVPRPDGSVGAPTGHVGDSRRRRQGRRRRLQGRVVMPAAGLASQRPDRRPVGTRQPGTPSERATGQGGSDRGGPAARPAEPAGVRHRAGRRGYARFAATVWNAGPSPLVVDGFRRANEDVDGRVPVLLRRRRQPGRATTPPARWSGTAGHGHDALALQDFARYRLLDADKQNVVRRSKEAFCLANTDAVDYTVRGRQLEPVQHRPAHLVRRLHVAVGPRGARRRLRRHLLPGPAGPVVQRRRTCRTASTTSRSRPTHDGVIHETDTDNNNSYRKIIPEWDARAPSADRPAEGDHRRKLRLLLLSRRSV